MLGTGMRIIVALLMFAVAVSCASPTPSQPTPAAPAKEAPKPAAATPAASNTGAKPAAKGPVEIRIGHGISGEEQLWLMKAKPDVTPNQGKVYTLNFMPFRANADRFTAFQSGQLDGGTVSAYTAIFAKGSDMPLKVVAGITGVPVEKGKTFNPTFLVMSDSGINKIEDLKGKTIGIFDYKSATDMWARLALAKHGLNPDRDVKLVVVGSPTMGTSLRTQKIDAGCFVQPYYHVEMNKGGVKELFDGKEGAPFYEDNMLVFFAEKFLKEQPDVVKAFLSDYVKATDYYLKNPKEAKQALLDAKVVDVDPNIYFNATDNYRPANGKVDMQAMAKIQDLIVTAGWADKKIDVNQLVDLSYLP